MPRTVSVSGEKNFRGSGFAVEALVPSFPLLGLFAIKEQGNAEAACFVFTRPRPELLTSSSTVSTF